MMVLTVQKCQVVTVHQWASQLTGRAALGLWATYYETSNHQRSEALLFPSVGALDTTGGKVKRISAIRY